MARRNGKARRRKEVPRIDTEPNNRETAGNKATGAAATRGGLEGAFRGAIEPIVV